MQARFAVIMAGGRGERFWPQSRLLRPKHLIPIVGDEPMLLQTINRLNQCIPPRNIYILCNRLQRSAILKSCPILKPDQVIGEPVGRDTAAAVGLATLLVKNRNPKAAFAILPADAVIRDENGFRETFEGAFAAAEKSGALVTIGVKPTRPATGYGYIRRGEPHFTVDEQVVYKVHGFFEKPDRETAERYLASGEYFWNAGIFIWRATVVEAAFQRHAATLWKGIRKIEEGFSAGTDLEALLDLHYPSLEKISVDYAILEKADNVLTVESTFDWDDVGEWAALERHLEKDAMGNVLKGDTLVQDGSDNIVVNDGKHLTALLGTDNLIVVQTPDATLVCAKDKAQDIKKLLRRIADNPDWEHLR